jgi:hypothetical protein
MGVPGAKSVVLGAMLEKLATVSTGFVAVVAPTLIAVEIQPGALWARR